MLYTGGEAGCASLVTRPRAAGDAQRGVQPHGRVGHEADEGGVAARAEVLRARVQQQRVAKVYVTRAADGLGDRPRSSSGGRHVVFAVEARRRACCGGELAWAEPGAGEG